MKRLTDFPVPLLPEPLKLLMWARDDWHAERIAKAWRMKLALLNKWHAGHGLDGNIVLRAGEDF